MLSAVCHDNETNIQNSKKDNRNKNCRSDKIRKQQNYYLVKSKTCKPCHSERSEESLKILRFAQDDIKVLDLTKH